MNIAPCSNPVRAQAFSATPAHSRPAGALEPVDAPCLATLDSRSEAASWAGIPTQAPPPQAASRAGIPAQAPSPQAASRAGVSAQAPPPQAASWAGIPAQAPPPEVSPDSILRAIEMLPRVDKSGHRYQVLAHADAPDGSHLVAYREGGWRSSGQPPRASYVAWVDGSGSVRWEAPAAEILAVAVDDARVLHLATESEHVRLSQDGRELSREPLPQTAREAWIDPTGGQVFTLDAHGHVLSTAGPLPFDFVDVRKLTSSPGGRSLLFTTRDGQFVEVNGAGMRRTWKAPVREPHGDSTDVPGPLQPLGDGQLLCQFSRNTWVRLPHRFPSGGFGRIGPIDPDPGDFRSEPYLRKTTADGTVVWQTAPMSEYTMVGTSRRGDVWCASQRPGPGQQTPVHMVGADGTLVEVARVQGAVKAMLTAPDGVLVVHGQSVTRLIPGRPAEPVPCPDGWTPIEADASGRLYLQDAGATRLSLYDPASGIHVVLTDVEGEHALGRTGELERLAAQLPPAQPPEPIREEDGWVIVDGIRVPRRDGAR